jgi:hypothetical protein
VIGQRITSFNDRPVDGATTHVRPLLLGVFPCDRCGWMPGFGCTCLGRQDRAGVEGRHRAAVNRATQPEPEPEPEPEVEVVAPVDPTGRGWAAA